MTTSQDKNVNDLCAAIANLIVEFNSNSDNSTATDSTEIEAAKQKEIIVKKQRRLTGLRLAAAPYPVSDKLQSEISQLERELIQAGADTKSLPLEIATATEYKPLPPAEEIEIRAAELEGLDLVPNLCDSTSGNLHKIQTLDQIMGLRVNMGRR